MKQIDLPLISDLELHFCEEYLRDRNATRAALAVGLSANYFPAATQAKQLLKKPQIREWLQYLKVQQAKQLKITVPKILREYALIAFSDLDYYVQDAEGRVGVRPGVPKKVLRAVKKKKLNRVECVIGEDVKLLETKTEIELHDKLHALDMLLKHFKDLPREEGEQRDGLDPASVVQIVAEHLARVRSVKD